MTTLLANPRLPDVSFVSDADVRRSLRAQIAKLEAELPPGQGNPDRGARLLTVEQLERTRDDLVRRIQERRFSGGEEQERKRRLREEMLLDPAAHFGMSVSNVEVGEPGCTRWSSWFRLRISGGCP
ncbi:MAG TPA: hypothetical protein VF066_03465 [Thermoleophilaceae bacterium]